MADISDLKIIGMDERRPPIVRKEPYIDLFFQLSHQAPPDWCDVLNDLTRNIKPKVKIDRTQGLFIETYVRDMNQIHEHLETVNKKIKECNASFQENIRQRTLAEAAKGAKVQGEGDEQDKLNAIIDKLSFDD
jgi:hypothetical protein